MPPATPFDPAAFRPHDHGRCRHAARAAVEAECRARGLRLTPARACVLDALLEEHRALTAYELLDRLKSAGLGRQPPIVYRALDFLLAHGFAHRVERLGAFVGCVHGTDRHRAAFFLCRSCRRVAEAVLDEPASAITASAEAAGFAPERITVEVEGLCAPCREGGDG
jgi:Fur family transcriptional regulator, zinc uptake regulator